MTEILLVRHAQSVMNLRNDLVNGLSANAELSQEGRRQARRLGEYFSQHHELGFDHAYASEAVRTQRTFIGAFDDVYTLNVDPRLNEMSQGECEGMPRVEVYTPGVLEQIYLLKENFKLPGGESMNQVADRMWEFILEAHELHDTRRVLAVTSGIAIKCLVGSIEGWDHQRIYETPVPNVSITSLSVTDERTTVKSFAVNTLA